MKLTTDPGSVSHSLGHWPKRAVKIDLLVDMASVSVARTAAKEQAT